VVNRAVLARLLLPAIPVHSWASAHNNNNAAPCAPRTMSQVYLTSVAKVEVLKVEDKIVKDLKLYKIDVGYV
jgi:hypothetical protein